MAVFSDFENHREDVLNPTLAIPKDEVASFCQEWGVRRLSIFGSAIRPDFRPDSDIDVLVEFEPDRIPGLLRIARMERELSHLFQSRQIDLRTPGDLSPYFREKVLKEAEVQYEREG